MVVVALVVLPRARVEEQVPRRELEDEAGEGPHVGRGGVLGAEEDLFGVVGFFCFFRLRSFFRFLVSIVFFPFLFWKQKKNKEQKRFVRSRLVARIRVFIN